MGHRLQRTHIPPSLSQERDLQRSVEKIQKLIEILCGGAHLDLWWMAGLPSTSGMRSVHSPYSFFCIWWPQPFQLLKSPISWAALHHRHKSSW